MRTRTRALVLAMALLAASCSGSGGSQLPAASSYEGFVAEQCVAIRTFEGVIANPDLNTYSPLMQSFADAIERGDAAAAAARAAELQSLLDEGRAHVRAGAGWAPAAQVMNEYDRLLAAVQRLIEARLAAIGKGAGPAERAGQAAFEAAGGVDAYFAWIKSANELVKAQGRPFPDCERSPAP